MKIVCKTRIIEPELKGLRFGVEMTSEENAYGLLSGICAEGREAIAVDWADGSSETVPKITSLVHAFVAPGRYEVRVSDDMGTLQVSAPMSGSPFNSLYPKRLRSVEIDSERLASLKNYAFVQCVNLETVRIRTAAPLSLPNYCFKNCVSLRRVELPSVTDIAECASISGMPFVGCTAELEIHFAKANEAAIRTTEAFSKYPTLGAERGVVTFDL